MKQTNWQPDQYLTPNLVQTVVPGLTSNKLRQMRQRGTSPAYYKPAGSRRVLYKVSDLVEWIETNRYEPFRAAKENH